MRPVGAPGLEGRAIGGCGCRSGFFTPAEVGLPCVQRRSGCRRDRGYRRPPGLGGPEHPEHENQARRAALGWARALVTHRLVIGMPADMLNGPALVRTRNTRSDLVIIARVEHRTRTIRAERVVRPDPPGPVFHTDAGSAMVHRPPRDAPPMSGAGTHPDPADTGQAPRGIADHPDPPRRHLEVVQPSVWRQLPIPIGRVRPRPVVAAEVVTAQRLWNCFSGHGVPDRSPVPGS